MATATAQLNILVSGLASGTKTIAPTTETYSASLCDATTFDIGVGSTTLTAPAGAAATRVTIVFPANTGGSTVVVKGNAADVGVTLATSATESRFVSMPTSGNVVITVGVATYNNVEVTWN